MKSKKPYTRKKANSFIRYSNLAFEMMAIIGGFTFLGYKIDQWMQNEFKAFTFGLMVLSVVIAIVHGIRGLLKHSNDENEKLTNRKKDNQI